MTREPEHISGSTYLMTFSIDGREYEFLSGKDLFSADRRARSNIPPAYVYKKPGDFRWDLYTGEIKLAKETAERFVSQYDAFRKTGTGLYIWSATKGSGKTMLACCLANAAIDMYGAVVKFISTTGYINLFGKGSDEDSVRILKNCGLLILDDLGAEDNKKEWIVERIYDLINSRYNNNLPTIVTSNNPRGQCHRDERIHSRVFGSTMEIRLPEDKIREALAAAYQQKFLTELRRGG